MRTHEAIDRRSLALAGAIVEKIDHDPRRTGLAKAKSVCARWNAMHGLSCVREWLSILQTETWEAIRSRLLDPSDDGRRLRQSSPFCGVLSPKERWEIYRKHRGP
jgi:hypothetical protein